MWGSSRDVTLVENLDVLCDVPFADVIDFLDVVTWPFVVLTGLLLLVFSTSGQRLLQQLRLQRVAGFGFEIELSPEGATELRVTLEQAFADYRSRAQTEFDRLSHKHKVDERLGRAVREAIEPLGGSGLRCTVYVQDPLFKDGLYCLVDYYPDGRARGRTFSIRFGIIGRAWRKQESQLEEEVSSDRKMLVHEWGMTAQEADVAQRRAADLMCVVLKDDGEIVGVLFASADPGSFDKGDDTTVESHSETKRLAKAVALVTEEMRDREPAIRIFDH